MCSILPQYALKMHQRASIFKNFPGEDPRTPRRGFAPAALATSACGARRLLRKGPQYQAKTHPTKKSATGLSTMYLSVDIILLLNIYLFSHYMFDLVR